MKLDKANFDQILRKYLAGQATQREIDFLHAYYNAFEQSPDFTDQLSSLERNTLENQINGRIAATLDTALPVKKINFGFFKYAAAILVVATLFTAYFFYTEGQNNRPAKPGIVKTSVVNNNDVVLKLSNGKEVKLTNDVLSDAIKENGATVFSKEQGELQYKTAQGQPSNENTYNEITIPYGKQFKITLADGTNVWLNAASSLKFPVAFKANERTVYVTGEAYFQVSKDASRPFTVHTKQSQIVVTGTEFNVASYPDNSSVTTTLVEGSVRVGFENQQLKLAPGEASISNFAGQPIIKSEADIENTISWKSGYFVFDQPLKEVMNILSRYYGVQIILDKKLGNSPVAGKFSNKRSIEQILTYIGQLKGFSFGTNGKTIEIRKIN